MSSVNIRDSSSSETNCSNWLAEAPVGEPYGFDVRSNAPHRATEDQPGFLNIDIKPDDFPNSINLGSAGEIPVAILSSEVFDALTIDEETISLASAGVRTAGRSGKFVCHEEVVNDDGFDDLVCQIETVELLIEPGQDTAELTAMTFDGTHIRGTGSIRIVPE